MKNKKELIIVLTIFAILIMGSILIYYITTLPAREQRKIEVKHKKEVARIAKINDENSNIFFNGIDRYKIEQKLESYDKRSKVHIISKDGKYYFANSNNQKSKPFVKIENLKNEFYSTGRDDAYSFWGREENVSNTNVEDVYFVNGFKTNNDCNDTNCYSNGFRNHILSCDLKSTIEVDGKNCKMDIIIDTTRYGDINNYRITNLEKVLCPKYEIIMDGKLIGKYEWVGDMVFKPYSSEMAYAVGEDCSLDSKNYPYQCKKYYVINNGIKSIAYGGVYDLQFSKDSRSLAYRIYDASKKKYSVVVNGIKQSDYDYVFGNTLKFSFYSNKISYIAANKCSTNSCFERGTDGGTIGSIHCDDYFLITEDQKPFKISGGNIEPNLFYIYDKSFKEHVYYTTGVDCTPLSLITSKISDDIQYPKCDKEIKGGCKYVQIKSTNGFVGDKVNKISNITLSPDKRRFVYVEEVLTGDANNDYNQIVYDSGERSAKCMWISSVDISERSIPNSTAMENILTYTCENYDEKNGNNRKKVEVSLGNVNDIPIVR